MLKLLIPICLIISVGINIALLTNVPKLDNLVLDIAENSFFIGCVSADGPINPCKESARLFRKELQ